MKVLFFDVQSYESDYLKENISDKFKYEFQNCPLDEDYTPAQEQKEAEILCVFISSRLNKKVLSKFPKLEFILTRSVGYSHIDLDYCKEHNIKIFNTPNYGDNTVAEFVFGILLNSIRNITQAQEDTKTDAISMPKYTGIELFNKTFGIIGTGAIGKNIIHIARGFKMNVIAYDPNANADVKYVELDTLFEISDIISINAPLNNLTQHLINKESIDKMKQGVIIVNAARGEIIETKALYEGLLSGKISYAALDVIECEEILCTELGKCKAVDSLKESCLKKFYLNQKLAQMPNVTITPHIAYNTKEAIGRILNMTIENLNSCANFTYGAKNQVLI